MAEKNNKRFVLIILGISTLLTVPLITMQFSDEVNWSVYDFMVAAILLFGTGIICELVLRTIKKRNLRTIICLTILGTLFLIWAELAVGVFGTPFAGS
jgi:hypothetical protein